MIDKILFVAFVAGACLIGHFAAVPLAGQKRNVLITWVGSATFAIFGEVVVLFANQPSAIDPVMVLVQFLLIGGAVAAVVEIAMLVLAMRGPFIRSEIAKQMIGIVFIGCLCSCLLYWYQSRVRIHWDNPPPAPLPTKTVP
jgi:hypothetical protein